MAALSWDEICKRAEDNNKTVICEVEKRGCHRCFRVKCNICGEERTNYLHCFHKCSTCAHNSQRSNTQEFINKSIEVHGNKFDYNLVKYVNNHTKIIILCNTCNNIFKQKPSNHTRGDGCLICANKKFSTDRRKSILDFVNKSKELNGEKYDYSLVEYINSHTAVKILCNKCDNIFKQTPSSHLRGSGCNICANNQKSNTEEFINKVKKIHCVKYNYDLVEYVNNLTKVKIKCNTCNNIFEQKPANHLKWEGCPKCNESKGENRVAKYLTKNNISFTPQRTFNTLRDKNLLFPDFYLEDLNLLIEYDGEGHYKVINRSKDPKKNLENFHDCQRRDKIKNEWAKANNIPLLRIPYWDFDRIEELVGEFIFEYTRKREMKQLVLEI